MKKGFIIGLVVSTILSLCAGDGFAQWVETKGPYGSSVVSFAADSANVFAGTIAGGIYRSTDGGIHWVKTNGTNTGTFALSLAAIGPDVLVGSGTGGGISLSTDDGKTWEAANNGLPTSPYGFQTGVIRAFIASGTRIFAGINDPNAVVYCSTDSGASWHFTGTGLTSGSISAFAVNHEGNDSIIVAGTNDGVFLSTNFGSTWQSAGLASESVRCLAFYQNDLFAASFYDGIFVSSDTGATWSKVDSGLTSLQASSLVSNGSELFFGTSDGTVFRYNNANRTWSAVVSGLGGNKVNTLFSNGSCLFAGLMGAGVFRSTDSGRSWNVSNTGMRDYSIYSMASHGNVVFASTYGSYRSTDDGSGWDPIAAGPALIANIDTVVFAAEGGGVSYSTDDGLNWTTCPDDSVPVGVGYTAFAAGNRDLYLGSAGVCDICNQGGVYLSTDQGGSWSYKGLSNISALATEGTSVYAADVTDSSAYVLVSTDGGSSWRSILSLPYYTDAIADREEELFVGTRGGGVLHSTDGGKDWSFINHGLSDSALTVTSLLVHGLHVFAGTRAGVFSLGADDSSWDAINQGFAPASDAVYALAGTDSDLFAGLYGGIWKRPYSQITAVEGAVPTAIPASFGLGQNYPNPFNPTTEIIYNLPKSAHVTLSVYDALGREIVTLVSGEVSAGYHQVIFNGSGFSSGVYFYRLTAGGQVITRKMLLLK